MEKFLATVKLFQKYATEYDFDYLMLAAQGYQESMLNQERRSPRGAVGIMQVLPKYAAVSPINIRNVSTVDGNIHAGVKMLRNIGDTYFKDDKIDSTNRTLLVFAAYNAGPNRIIGLRKKASAMGLNPNVWFSNGELVAGQEMARRPSHTSGTSISITLRINSPLMKQPYGRKPRRPLLTECAGVRPTTQSLSQ